LDSVSIAGLVAVSADDRRLLRRVAYASVVFVVLLAGGACAFMVVGGESFGEAAYRALGAFTTADVVDSPESDREKIIAAVLTLTGGLFYLGLVATVVKEIVERNLLGESLREARRRRRIASLNGHYVVCGFGRVGRAVTRALRERNVDVVVVEARAENRADAEALGAHVVLGDADVQETLERAHVGGAAGLVACVGSDAENIYIALAARRCHKTIRVVARASSEDAEKNLRSAKALVDEVISPDLSLGRQLADAVIAGTHS
jgi:voltage-gated potassium channel